MKDKVEHRTGELACKLHTRQYRTLCFTNGGDYMLGYRMIVNKDPKDNLTWSLTFDDDNSQYNKAETEEIFSVAHDFVAVLSKLQQK